MTTENPNERFRLFVAIPFRKTVRNKIIRVQQELRRLVPHDTVRWTKPEQFHLTLRFLGDVSSDCAAALKESVHTVCSGEPALHLCAQGVGFFPNTRSPRVIWVGINDSERRLADLQKKIESAVRRFTEEPGGENFAGHVTLCRFKRFKRHGNWGIDDPCTGDERPSIRQMDCAGNRNHPEQVVAGGGALHFTRSVSIGRRD